MEDLIGKRFGHLMVLSYAGDYKWLCRCDCGTEKQVRSYDLKSGKTRSCGCLKKELIRKRNLEDLTGMIFGRLTVLGIANDEFNNVTWRCRCQCGNIIDVPAGYLKSGDTKSCGCLKHDAVAKHNFVHGFSGEERLYHVWKGMRERCNNPNSKSFKNYGGRGIRICDEWDSYLAFRNWALSNGYDESKPARECSIDRIDNGKGYSPDNCRWVDMATQAANRRQREYKPWKSLN